MEDRAVIIPTPSGVRDYNSVTLHVAWTGSGIGKGAMEERAKTRFPRRTSMTVITRELGLKPNAKKELQKNLRNKDHPTTLALKAVGVTYAVTGKGRGGKSELVKAA